MGKYLATYGYSSYSNGSRNTSDVCSVQWFPGFLGCISSPFRLDWKFNLKKHKTNEGGGRCQRRPWFLLLSADAVLYFRTSATLEEGRAVPFAPTPQNIIVSLLAFCTQNNFSLPRVNTSKSRVMLRISRDCPRDLSGEPSRCKRAREAIFSAFHGRLCVTALVLLTTG